MAVRDVFGTRQQEIVSMIGKMYVAGKYNIIDFDNTWKTSIQQRCLDSYILNKNITRVTPSLYLEIEGRFGDYSYGLQENENIQFFSPNLVDIQTYSNYVKYEYLTPNMDNLEKDVDTTLKPGQSLTLFWKTTEDSNYQYYKYGEGDIIKPSFVVYPSRTSVSVDLAYGAGVVLDPDANTAIEEFKTTLSSNRQIVNRKLNVVQLSNNFNYIYWIRNYTALDNAGNKVYELFDDVEPNANDGSYTYVLHSGEYLLYTNESFTSLNIVGAGTEIKFYANPSVSLPLTVPVIDYSSIISDGLSAISEDTWYVFTRAEALMELTEMQFVTLGKGCTVHFRWAGESSAPSYLALSNEDIDIQDWEVFYQIDGDTTTYHLPAIDDALLGWTCRTTLDVNLTKDTPQILVDEYVEDYYTRRYTSIEYEYFYSDYNPSERYTDYVTNCRVLSDHNLFIGGSASVSTEFIDEQSNVTYLHIYPYQFAEADPDFEFLSDNTVRLRLAPGEYNGYFTISYELPYRSDAQEVSMYLLAGYILKMINPSTELRHLGISQQGYGNTMYTLLGHRSDFGESGVYFIRVPGSGTLRIYVEGSITKTTYITFECCKYGAIKFLSSGSGSASAYDNRSVVNNVTDDQAKLVILEQVAESVDYLMYQYADYGLDYTNKFDVMYEENEAEKFDPFDPLDYFNPSNPVSSHTLAKLADVSINVINRG